MNRQSLWGKYWFGMTDVFDIRNNPTGGRSDSSSLSGEGKRAHVKRSSLSHTRSGSPTVTVAGRKPSESQYAVDPTPKTSDGKNHKTDAALSSFDKDATRRPKKRVEDPRKDVRVVRVEAFHLFY